MASFEAWLTQWHETADEVWVLFPKKGVEVPSITRSETLDVALCFGWIDGKAMSGNAPQGWWSQRFTPRRKRSTWSKVNRVRVAKLIAAGRMRPAGLRQVELAKADGRWEAAYDSPSRAEVSPEFAAALAASPAATAAWEKLGSGRRYVMIVTLQKLKRPETRQRRIGEFIATLAASS
ncbi:YdeI family protein [Micromonospora sp. NPDC048871]|uniref:YdeI/OmpD-associated family protein n=1 Tax=unclassified Micromonospora TaxID=2617518 RepID=UPI0033C1AEF8